MAATMASPLGGYEQIRGSFVRALGKTERFFKSVLGIDTFAPVGRAPQAKKFSVGAVLAVATGRNIAPNGMDDVRAVLNHMMGRDLFTGEIAAYDRDCRQILLAQIPQLRAVDLNSLTHQNTEEVMRKAFGAQYPRTFEVLPLDRTQLELLENRVNRVAEYRQPAPLRAGLESVTSFDQVKNFSEVKRALAAGADVRPAPTGVRNPLTHVIFVLPLEERLFAVRDMLAKGADAVHSYAHGTKPAEMAAMVGDNQVLATLMDHGAKFGKNEFIAMVQGAQDRIERMRASSDRRDYGFVMSGMHACMREAFGRMEERDVMQMLRDPEIQRELDRSPTLRGMVHSAQQMVFDPIERAKIGINLSQPVSRTKVDVDLSEPPVRIDLSAGERPAHFFHARTLSDVEKLLDAGVNTRPPIGEGNPLMLVISHVPASERAAAVTAMLTKGNADAVSNFGSGASPLRMAALVADPQVIGVLMDRGAKFDKDAFFGVLQGARKQMDDIRDRNGPAEEWRAAVGGVKNCLSEAFKRMEPQEREALLNHPDIQRAMRAGGADVVWEEAKRAVDQSRLGEAIVASAPRAKASGPSMG